MRTGYARSWRVLMLALAPNSFVVDLTDAPLQYVEAISVLGTTLRSSGTDCPRPEASCSFPLTGNTTT